VTEDAIRRVLASYGQTCDDGRFDEFATLFAADATFQALPGEPVRGRDAIRDFMAAAYTPEVRGKHLLGEPLITADGDTATAATDFAFMGRTAEGGWAVTVVGRYQDDFARGEDGAWRFTRHVIAML
jgi:uncharacterized protein (TIGR02246 family)